MPSAAVPTIDQLLALLPVTETEALLMRPNAWGAPPSPSAVRSTRSSGTSAFRYTPRANVIRSWFT
jgi:hypothetical protein